LTISGERGYNSFCAAARFLCRQNRATIRKQPEPAMAALPQDPVHVWSE
jgi:hypothetical protein